jgi:large subunit ribosomal protein L2
MPSLLLKYILDKASKRLAFGAYGKNGRNHFGRITVFHRGGGLVKQYRKVDYYRRLNLFGYVCKIIYDGVRTSFLGLIFYENGLFSYIILSDTLKIGDKLYSGNNLSRNKSIQTGSAFLVKKFFLFDIINNIELKPYKGAALARAAGMGVVIVSKNIKSVTLKMKSGWLVTISAECIGTLGYVSNILHNLQRVPKAGKNRVLGIRPTVRGVAMNPCDHPHGGGNGKTSPPRAPVSP